MRQLGKRADPSLADSTGRTPLHAAAQAGSLEIAAALLDAGAELNAQDRDMEGAEEFRSQHFQQKTEHRTALHYAAERLDCALCEALLARGAVANVRDCWYKTPLQLVEDEPASEEQLRTAALLLSHKADANLGNMELGRRTLAPTSANLARVSDN